MPLITRNQVLVLLLGLALGCGDEPSGLSTGNLYVTVTGLPAGSSANLLVSGPGGYSQVLTGTQTLTSLASGTYTVAASSVSVGLATYSGAPASQTVAVGNSTATASVVYSTGLGALSVNVIGLGTSADAIVSVTGPNGYTRDVTETETLQALIPGTYTVAAQNVVAAGGTPHSPSPATQDVAVSPGSTASTTVTYAPPSSGDLNLTIAGLYVTQSAQTYDGSVPLVKDRNGYLRVFVVANRTNVAIPSVQVTIFNSADVVVSTVVIPAPGLSVPTSVNESSLSYSWNTAVSGTLIQPGFRIEAEVDPGALIAESSETDNRLVPPAPVVQTVPTLNVTFVPVIQQRHAARGDVGNVTLANRDQFLALTRQMHPIAGYNTTVRAPYTTTTADTLQAENQNGAWGTILLEIETIRALENPTRHYYGVAKVSYTSGVAGVAYVSGGVSEQSALGWDYMPTGAAVAAHELGHNWGRNHAPCGGPSGLDNGYPFSDGRIGVYGVNVESQTLMPATMSDIMGYCDPKWIGDYTYKAVMSYLISPPPAPVVSAELSQAEQPCLLVWGHIRNGEMVLEPAFRVNTRPRMPRRPGLYSVDATAEDGSRLFSLSFAPSQIA
ncbi:MAG TPA: zinc-dependent metalloprotease family protein, partial [Gemmatimonadales bacterium]|nr:zinc-dependent metalloprotease family protein [Gemmatimonadales bacterium]